MSKLTLRSRTVLGLCALLLSAAGLAQAGRHAHRAGAAPAPVHDHGHHEIDALLNMHDQEIHFTENKGQFSPGVLFRADFPYGQAVATPQGMVVTAFDPAEVDKRIAEGFAIEEEQRQGRPARELSWRRRGHAWQLRFVGGNATVRAEGRDAHPEVSNYFVGDRQAADVRSFQEVWYRDVYPGIDVRYYPAKDGSLEYDLIVMPGADAGRIAIAHDGIGKMRVNEQGELLIETLLGELAHPAPYVYQRINGKEIAVASRYTIEGTNTLRFKLGAYDKQHPLVIDPIAMRWATWINTNSSDDNHGHCIWVDPTDGAIYVVARVVGTTDQITPGAFDETANGNLEMIVGKYLEPSTVGGSGTRVWQTYIGGNGDDNPYAMEQGPDGNLYITGQTSSTNFPLLGGSAFSGSSINQQGQSGIDVFVLKINTAGNSIKAAVVGGNGSDDNYDVRLAANGDVFVAGSTTSTNLSTLNPGSGASNTNNGSADVLLFRINQDLSSLVWMRNYGGSGSDRASIMLHNPVSGDLFVGGNTSSTNFPTVSPRQSTRGGTSAGFIQRLNGATAATAWSSYFSSDANDDANLLCMEFNADRTQLYFGGVTEGLNSANITNGTYDTGHNGSNDFYVARMDIDQNYLGGTYVGGSANEVNMMGLNVDQNNDVYVFGYSNSTNFPMSTAPNVPLQSTNQGSNDKVFFKLESDLSALEFSTYYGGTADDYDPVGERGIKFSNCRIYTIVTARSNNIPLTQGALNTTKVSGTTRYEPGLVVWANPPDLLGNSITYEGVSICPGATPGNITGSLPSYVLPTVVRNNSASGYPSFGNAASYQWQTSTDSLTWTDIPGATGQDLPGSLIGPISQDTYLRRIIGGDACILAGAADQVVRVRIMSVSGTVTDVSCAGGNDGSITATADGQPPFSFVWSNGQTTATAVDLAAGTYTVTVTDANGCAAVGTFSVGQPSPLSANVNTTLDVCNTGTGGATASGIGGTPGYGYTWSTGAVGPNLSNVPAGSYSVTVTDLNQCTATVPVIILGTVPPGANAGNDVEITCATGASVQLNGSSTTPGMNFAWTGPGIVSGAGSASPTVNAAGTYVLVVTDPQTGCTSSDQASVTVNTTVPGAMADGGTITCSAPCVVLNGGGNGSFAWSGPGGFTSTEQNPTVCAPGTYTLTVTGANGCTSTATAEVTSDTDAPTAEATGGTINCNLLSTQLQGSGDGSLAWTGPNGFTSSEADPVVNVAGTYTLTVTGANGCTTSIPADVTISGTTASAGANGGEISCLQPSVQLQGASLTPNVTYAWSGPGAFTSSEQNPVVSLPGTYTLTVTGASIQTENGPLACVGTAEAVVTGNTGAPGANASGGTITCNNECVTLQGSGNGSYSWSGPNDFTSTEQNPTVCAPGTYTLTVTGTNGCTSTATAEVDEDVDVPGAQAAGGTLTCNNECVTLQGVGNGSYSWSGPNGFTSTEQNPTVCAPGTYTLTVTGTNGCTSTATAEVGEDVTVPGAQAGGGTITCNNECVTLQGSGNGSFAWSGPDGFTSTEQNPTVCAPGTYTLTVTGANGCTSTATAEVDEDVDVPGAQAAGGTLTCNNQCVTLAGSGNGSYSWSGPDGFISTEQNPTVCTPGTYTLTVTGSNGCTSTATAEVGQDVDVPGAQATGGTLTCNNECVTLQGVGNGSYSWSGPNGFTSTEQNPTVCAPGTYTLTVTGTNGCTSTATAEVDEDVDVPGAQAAGGTLTCNNQCVTLAGSGNGSYSWSGPDGFISTEQNPTVCAPGTYTLTVTGTNGCTSTATAEVDEDVDVPGAQAAGGTLTCNNECVTLQGVGNGSYSWSGPNGFTSTEQNPTVCAPGTYTLTVTGTNGCTSTATAEVGQDVNVPGAQAAGGTLTCNNECVTLQGVGNGSYSWSGPNGFTSTEQNPTVCTPGTYTLTVTGTNGCTSTATAEVGVDVEAPVVSINTPAIVNCNPSWVWINATSSLPGDVVWTLPGGGTITEALIIQEQGPGIYTLTVTAANGCVGTAQTEVIYDQVAPDAEVSATYIGCEGEAATLSFTSTSSIFQIIWSAPNGTVISNGPTALASEPGIYTLALVGMNGCSDQFQVEVMQDPNCDDCPPIIISCPPDITVSCAEDFSPFGISGEPVWRKKQDCPEITSLGWNDEILSNCPYVIRRTFWAEDATGAYGTCSHTITVIDDVAPIFMEVPEKVTLSCDQNIDALPMPEVWAYDECTKMEVAVDHTVQYLPGSCAGTYTLVHSWTAVDQCGNVGQASWTITVVDEDAPQFTCEVEDMVVYAMTEVPEPADCKAFDNCSGEVYVQFTEQVVKSSACKGGLAVVRTWYAVDACGNPATMQQTITVCDKKPGKDEPGAGVTLQDALAGGAKVSTEVVPNPFRLDCTIILTPAVTGHATVEITDMQGRKVTDLFSGLVERDVPVRLIYRPEDRGGAMYLYRVILDGEAVHGRLLYQP